MKAKEMFEKLGYKINGNIYGTYYFDYINKKSRNKSWIFERSFYRNKKTRSVVKRLSLHK